MLLDLVGKLHESRKDVFIKVVGMHVVCIWPKFQIKTPCISPDIMQMVGGGRLSRLYESLKSRNTSIFSAMKHWELGQDFNMKLVSLHVNRSHEKFQLKMTCQIRVMAEGMSEGPAVQYSGTILVSNCKAFIITIMNELDQGFCMKVVEICLSVS